MSLNPYCNGRWLRTANAFTVTISVSLVLILIVVDDGLVPIRQVAMGAAAVS